MYSRKINWTVSKILVSVLLLASCGKTDPTARTQPSKALPFLGEHGIARVEKDGNWEIDTLFYRIPDFHFINQQADTISRKNLEGKIVVADFFFTTCPTICPVMKKELLRVYEAYGKRDAFLILSHSIDPEYDTVQVLADYATALGVTAPPWHFLTGNYDSIYAQADAYMVSALEDPEQPGGFVHDGTLVLLDGEQHIRGLYSGVDPKSVDQLISDIQKLLPAQQPKINER